MLRRERINGPRLDHDAWRFLSNKATDYETDEPLRVDRSMRGRLDEFERMQSSNVSTRRQRGFENSCDCLPRAVHTSRGCGESTT